MNRPPRREGYGYRSRPPAPHDLPPDGNRVVFGVRPVDEVCRARAREVAVVYVAEGHRAGEIDAAIASAKDRGITVEIRPRDLVASVAGPGATHQGIVALVGGYPYATLEEVMAAVAAAPRPALLLLLDQVTDPHNLGALVRNAEVFGAQGVIIPERASAPVTAAAVKASAGATERMKICRVANLLKAADALRAAGVRVLGAASDRGEPLHEVDLTGPVAWVLGAEGTGMREAVARRCDGLCRIPQLGTIGSLNVSVAGGVLLYETVRQRGGTPTAE